MKLEISESEMFYTVMALSPGTELRAKKGEFVLCHDGVDWGVKSIKYLGNLEWAAFIEGAETVYRGGIYQKGIRQGDYDLAWFSFTRNAHVVVVAGEMYDPRDEKPLRGFICDPENSKNTIFIFKSSKKEGE